MTRQFLDLADPLPEAMCLISGDAHFVAVNTAMAEMLSVSRQEFKGHHAKEFIVNPEEQTEKLLRYIQNCQRSRELIPGAIEWRKQDGTPLPCRCSGAVIPPSTQDSSPLILMRCTLRDVGDNKFSMLNSELENLRKAHIEVLEQKEQLEKTVAERTALLKSKADNLALANKELDQFAYVTSHDLKAPLRAIANLSQWIEEDIGDVLTPDARQQMDLLRGRVHRMEGLIEGILNYSRVGRTAADNEEVNVAALLAETVDNLAPPKQYSVNVGPGMPVLMTPRVQLSQIFANLISNAIKYRERDDGCVSVTVRDAADFHEFSVTDDGPGIPESFHEKIFQIFQTLQARDTLESTGIGLTVVKKIIEGHGGTIELESTEGEGTTFRFTWPKESEKDDVI